jgi:hypothetical protein
MTTDIILNESSIAVDGDDRITFKANLVIAESWDFQLNHPDRRSDDGTSQWRRALVHDFDDSLTINYGGDYPNGVLIRGPLKVRGGLRIEEGRMLTTLAPVVPDLLIPHPINIARERTGGTGGTGALVGRIRDATRGIGGSDLTRDELQRLRLQDEPRSLLRLLTSMSERIDNLEARLAALG